MNDSTSSTPPAVRATALGKSFGSGEARAEVLRGLSFELAPGETKELTYRYTTLVRF